MRARAAKAIVLTGAIICLVLFARSILHTQAPVTMSIRAFVTNDYIFPPKEGPTTYIYAIVAVTNNSNKSLICSAKHSMPQAIFGENETPWGGLLRTLGPHSGFTFEKLVFRGFTNKVELTFTATQKPWPFRHLPDALLRTIPKKLHTPQELKVSTPEFYVTKGVENR